jgi:hypothetical protein
MVGTANVRAVDDDDDDEDGSESESGRGLRLIRPGVEVWVWEPFHEVTLLGAEDVRFDEEQSEDCKPATDQALLRYCFRPAVDRQLCLPVSISRCCSSALFRKRKKEGEVLYKAGCS